MKNDEITLSQNQYLPDVRSYYTPADHDLITKSPEGVNSKLPSTVTDDIVVNNIACAEFDYTENSYIDSTFNSPL